jgi:signal transduction histidine kinase
VLVIVEDDGVGFETAEMHQSGHLGLMGIQERVQMLSGTFEIETSLGCGTTVVVEVPYVDSNTDRR